MRHNFSKILTLYYIAINLEISDFEMSDKFLDPSIASHEALLYFALKQKQNVKSDNFVMHAQIVQHLCSNCALFPKLMGAIVPVAPSAWPAD